LLCREGMGVSQVKQSFQTHPRPFSKALCPSTNRSGPRGPDAWTNYFIWKSFWRLKSDGLKFREPKNFEFNQHLCSNSHPSLPGRESFAKERGWSELSWKSPALARLLMFSMLAQVLKTCAIWRKMDVTE
jgi:hypothetical protein